MLIFELCSIFDHQLSILSDESCLKCKTMVAKSSKNEMFISGLHLTSEDCSISPDLQLFQSFPTEVTQND